MSLQLKAGVKLGKLQPQMALAAAIVHSVYQRNNAACTITSANDSKHMDGSLHYEGRALDFRTKNYVSNKLMLVAEIKKALGNGFDAILESADMPNEHIHVEWRGADK